MATTLTDVLESLGSPTLAPWVVPGSKSDAQLTDVVIYDRAAPEHIEPGAVVLAVGLLPNEAIELLDLVAQDGGHAMVIRGERSHADAVVTRARELGVALLGAAPTVAWAQIASLLRNVLSTTGAHFGEGDVGLSHGDLTSVANNLASAVNGSVLLFNPQQEVLAFSRLRPDDDLMRHQAVLDQHGPAAYRERLREMGVYKRLWSTDEVVSIPALPEFSAGRREAIVIRAGEEILGSIWVAEGDQPLSPDVDQILRGAAAAASGQLVWLQARAQAQRRFAEDLVAQLVSGEADALASANWLGVQADRPCAALVLAVPDAASRRRLSNVLSMHFSAFRYSVLTFVSRGTVHVALCDLPPSGLNLDSIRDVVSRAARTLSVPVLGAVGTTEGHLAGLATSHRRADSVLRVLRAQAADNETHVAGYEEVRTQIQLEQLTAYVNENPDLASGHAKVLLAWDREHGTELAVCLRGYLEAFGSVTRTSKRLGMHPNTVRYRVRRACEISGLDINDPAHRLVAQLQLNSSALSDATGFRPPIG